jgi:hypothetical protein
LIERGSVAIDMAFQGLDRQQAAAIWRPFFDWVGNAAKDYGIVSAPQITERPARRYWDPSLLGLLPGAAIADDRSGAPADNVFWASNVEEAGAVWYTYQSAWLPASLLEADQRYGLVDALFAAAKHLGIALHVNKGLAGATPEAIASAKDTTMNPAVADAFALVIAARWESPPIPAFPDMSRMRRPLRARLKPPIGR